MKTSRHLIDQRRALLNACTHLDRIEQAKAILIALAGQDDGESTLPSETMNQALLGVVALLEQAKAAQDVSADENPRLFAATPYQKKFFIEVNVSD